MVKKNGNTSKKIFQKKKKIKYYNRKTKENNKAVSIKKISKQKK